MFVLPWGVSSSMAATILSDSATGVGGSATDAGAVGDDADDVVRMQGADEHRQRRLHQPEPVPDVHRPRRVDDERDRDRRSLVVADLAALYADPYQRRAVVDEWRGRPVDVTPRSVSSVRRSRVEGVGDSSSRIRPGGQVPVVQQRLRRRPRTRVDVEPERRDHRSCCRRTGSRPRPEPVVLEQPRRHGAARPPAPSCPRWQRKARWSRPCRRSRETQQCRPCRRRGPLTGSLPSSSDESVHAVAVAASTAAVARAGSSLWRRIGVMALRRRLVRRGSAPEGVGPFRYRAVTVGRLALGVVHLAGDSRAAASLG